MSLGFIYPIGVHFECQRCANCCRDTEKRIRRILLSEVDVRRIREKTKLQTKNFAYLLKGETPFKLEMKKINGKCIFLKGNKCRIYLARPLICRCFPFWIEKTKESFIFKVSSDCPGIGKGKLLGKSLFIKLLKLSFEAYRI